MRTVQLGQFTEENAERIVQRLETAGIPWTIKRPGALARIISISDWGIRIFVDEQQLAGAQDVARGVLDP